MTKEEKNEQNKLYYLNNKEKIKENARLYYNKNKEVISTKRKVENIDENKHNIKKEIGRIRYANNKEKVKKYQKKRYEEKNEKIKESVKKYRIINRDKINLYRKTCREKNNLYKIKSNYQTMISKVLKRNGYTKISKAHQILGCSFEEFKQYIEKQFEPWMNWENYGLYNGELNYGWDIDHVIPQSQGKTEEEITKLNHYTNLKPLCSKINRDMKRSREIIIPTS